MCDRYGWAQRQRPSHWGLEIYSKHFGFLLRVTGNYRRLLNRRVTLNFYKITLAIVWTTNYKKVRVDRKPIRRLPEKREHWLGLEH